MKSGANSSFTRWALVLCAFTFSSTTGFGQSVSGFVLGKIQNFRQTSSAAPVVDSAQPFQFGALITPGTATINSATLTFNGTSSPRTFTDEGNNIFEILDTFMTQAALDAAYQTGNFTLSINSSDGILSTSIFLLPLSYPVTAPLTVPAGDWQNNAIVIDPSLDYTITWGPFSNANAVDVIQFAIRNSIVIPPPFPATQTSFTVPAGSLQPNTDYSCDLAFARVAGATTGGTDIGPGFATFAKDTGFMIHTTGGQATPTPSPTGSPGEPTPTPSGCDWNVATVYPLTIESAAVTSVNGHLYSFGGLNMSTVTADSFRFDGNVWTPIAALPQAFSGATAVSDGTNIYIAGGSGGGVLNTFYKYDPLTNSYTPLAPMPTATAGHAAVYLAGKIYKFSGTIGSIFPSQSLEIYDIALNTWTAGADCPQGGVGIGAFGQGNFIYGAGGFSLGGPSTKTYRYDPATNTWDDAAIADLPEARYNGAAAWYNGRGILAGGTIQPNVSASVIFWDAASNTWVTLPNMLSGRTFTNGAVLNGSFFVVGGRPAGETPGSNDNQRLTCAPIPTPTPGATPTPTPVVTATPTPGPTASATAEPSATPTPGSGPAQALNISTRMRVDTGSNVLIGGFIVTGTADKTSGSSGAPKEIAVRGIGPSLGAFGVPDALADPTLELRDSGNVLILADDNWQDNSTQAARLIALDLALSDSNESGLVATLQPGAYTAVLAGKNNGTGVGLMEIYDTSPSPTSQLSNISTRGLVLTGSNVMIGGFILGGTTGNTNVVVRGIGPSLAEFGLSPVLADPTLELHNSNGATLVANNDWQDDSTSASQLTLLGLNPSNVKESGIYTSLPPGAFTAVLAGTSGGTGIGLVEIYNVH